MNYKSRTYVDLHVIDAIDSKWLKQGYSEALMLRYFLKDTNIQIVSHLAWDIKSLQCVIAGITDYRPHYCDPRKAIPYLHISCHGTKLGLHLGDSPLMPWSSLSEVLLPLQIKTDYNVPLSLSSCWGYHGATLAYVMDAHYRKRRPYYSLVGPTRPEKMAPLCNAFGVFYYNLLVRYRSMKQSVIAANQNGNAKLDYTYGSEVAEAEPEKK